MKKQRNSIEVKVNLSTLEELSSGDSNFMKELINDFVSQVPQYINNLEESIKKKETEQVFFLTHKLRSPLFLFGITQLEKEFNFVEENLKKLSLDNQEIIETLQLIISSSKLALSLVKNLIKS